MIAWWWCCRSSETSALNTSSNCSWWRGIWPPPGSTSVWSLSGTLRGRRSLQALSGCPSTSSESALTTLSTWLWASTTAPTSTSLGPSTTSFPRASAGTPRRGSTTWPCVQESPPLGRFKRSPGGTSGIGLRPSGSPTMCGWRRGPSTSRERRNGALGLWRWTCGGPTSRATRGPWSSPPCVCAAWWRPSRTGISTCPTPPTSPSGGAPSCCRAARWPMSGGTRGS
mmetsp:Transcript_30769/g.98261  ORF Transcript_30769/g.98261 Transcript_30769/m.98261 type:complete len:226 (+) Transcript_30769:350-1027(+)